MKTAGDTSAEAWQAQLRIYRGMSPEQRLRIALDLTELSRSLLEAGVRRRKGGSSPQEVKAETIRLWLRGTA